MTDIHSQSDQSSAMTTVVDASVYITTRLHVRLEAPWDGLGALLDKEKVERDLDECVEAHGGQLPEGVTVEHTAVNSETEVW